MKSTFRVSLKAVTVILSVGVCGEALAQSDVYQDQHAAVVNEGGDEEMGKADDKGIVVAGSRLVVGDVTANTRVITADEIDKRGLTTAEEIIRQIPENFASINSATNLDNDADLDVGLGSFGSGVTTANLRGIGSGTTLVLINGRRVAGAAGQPEFFANLSNIPAASIERVEINLDGGSAVYGSDAVAGTINIVLKRGYTGGQISAFQELSETGADRLRVSGNFGTSWTTGDINVSASYTQTKPVSNAKAGFTTLDYTGRINDPRADLRAADFGPFVGVRGTGPRSALICNPATAIFGCSQFGPFNSILPPRNDGTAFTFDQLQALTVEDFAGLIPEDATGLTDDYAVNASIRQELGAKVTLTVDGLYTNSRVNRRIDQLPSGRFLIPASNAFNLTGEPVAVSYDPIREIAAGIVSLPAQRSENEFWSIAPTLEVKLTNKIDLIFEYAHSKSTSFNTQTNFSAELFPFTFFELPPEIQAEQDRLAAILADSNPATAPNFFGDGSSQNESIAEFIVTAGDRSGTSTLDTALLYARGDLIKLPGGPVSFVVGSEYRRESFSASERNFGVVDGSVLYGVDEPSRELVSGFAEFSVPIFGNANARRGLQRLVLNGQIRYDDYTLVGGTGFDDNFNPLLDEANFSALTASLGILWSPTKKIDARVKFSEGFRAPNTADIFTVNSFSFISPVFDPQVGSIVFVPDVFGANINLQPEESDNYSAGLTYRPFENSSLIVEANYSYLDFRNRIASAFELDRLLGAEAFSLIPEIFVRDANGTLIQFNSSPINISRRVSENLDVSISGALETDIGSLRPSIFVTYVISQFDQATGGAPKIDTVGEIRGRDRYTVIGTLDWDKGPWTGNLRGTFTPGYVNTEFDDPSLQRSGLPVPDVARRFVLDLSVGYRFDMGLRLNAGAKNILGADFPFALSRTGVPFDTRRIDLRGQTFFLSAALDF